MARAPDPPTTVAAGPLPLRQDRVVVVYLVVLAVVVAQILVIGDTSRVLRGALPYAVAAIVYVDLRWSRHRGVRDETLLSGLGIAGSVLAAWMVVGFLRALPSGLGDPSGFYRVKVQVTSPLGDHNTAAGLLVVAIVVVAARISHDRRWWVGLAVCALGLVATLSRGAALVLLVVTVLAWRCIGDRRIAWRVLVVGMATTVAIVALAAALGAAPPGPGAPGAAPDARGPLGSSLVGRGDLILRGGQVFADEPLLGVGLGGFGDHADDLPPPNHHAHNLLANAAAEGGVGLLLVAAALPLVLVVRWRRRSPSTVRDVLLLGGAALVLHAQHDILGGLLGYEALLAVLLAVGGPGGAVQDRSAPVGQ